MEGNCRIDKEQLIELGDLGKQFVSDFVEDPQDGEKSSLKVGIGNKSGLVQLYESFSPEKIYRKYWYRSGINETMVQELKSIVQSAKEIVEVQAGDTVLDIASNDGTLLSFWDTDVFRVGIDPALNLKPLSQKHANAIVEDFFSSENFFSVAENKAKVITSIAMFYDVEKPSWFIEEIKKCLADDGVWILQMSYMPLMLEQNAFDNILAEHIMYYSFTVLNNLLQEHGLKAMDVELNGTNSGSFRVYIRHDNDLPMKRIYHEQQIGEFRVNSLLAYEKELDLLSPKPYKEFFARVEKNKKDTLDLLQRLKDEGKTVLGYGASTKGNVTLQYYGITPDLIANIAERTPEKVGKKTIGTGIPIISEEEMRKSRPDYLFIFPWHFTQVFKEREKELRAQGTKFIVPLPYVKIE